MIDVFNKYEKSMFSLKAVSNDKQCKYGIVRASQIEPNFYRINQLVEKPSVEGVPSNIAMVGRYILTPDVFDEIR